MSFSDLILAILILTGAACIVWILDINPYDKKLHVYTQTCDNMILENTYCKGNWQDNPIEIFVINQDTKQIISKLENQHDSSIYESCTIRDRKNWLCSVGLTQQNITVKDGQITYSENSDTRQITRLEWLQNKFLKIMD
ncbi:MAG: hypothetical protein GKR92_03785 [Gammaproteobacteria bacterium]|nr:MAG: hypothetical protein GKR92_03785 [Gammaproteobacteria bacterium]